MEIAIIGVGNVGSALAARWAAAGHRVTLGVRDPDDDRYGELAARTRAAGLATPAAAAAAADVVVLAVPWDAAPAVCKALGDLAGRIVVDCTNPLIFEGGELRLDRGYETSGGEAVAGWLPGARLVKTLNQATAEVMAGNDDLPQRPVMFLAGDDDKAKAVVAPLVETLGFEVLDAGGLDKARLLEPFGMVCINQAVTRGMGREWAFGVLRRRGGD